MQLPGFTGGRVLPERWIILLDVGPPYDAGIGRHAAELGLRVIRAGGDISGFLDEPGSGLCVTTLRGHELDPVARVRLLKKQLGSIPLVVLAERLGSDLTLRLDRNGADEIIEVPAASADVAARILALPTPQALPASPIVGEGRAMRAVREQVAAVAKTRTTVLLQGETGTGKGLVARTIHDLSQSANEPWVHVDCSALSSTVIESELFGHERGSFTGADSRRPGRFELAGRGTVFLDEIGDLDAPLQTKLLRVLHDRVFERVGGTRTLPMNARIIAATSHDLREAVDTGTFRSDLYFRLAVAPIYLPALRDRRSDIPLLVRDAIGELCERLDCRVPRLTNEFYARLQELEWPGNIRELLNCLERCLVYFQVDELGEAELDEILTASAYAPRGSVPAEEPRPRLLDTHAHSEESRVLVERALIETAGNVSRAARRLGVPRGTLRHRIRVHNLNYLIPKD